MVSCSDMAICKRLSDGKSKASRSKTALLRGATSLALAIVMVLPAKEALTAGTATTTLTVSATVVKSCQISATPVAFGQYNPLQESELQSQGDIELRCASGTTPTVALDNGQFSQNVSVSKTFQTDGTTPKVPVTDSGVTITRAMQNAGTWLAYDLFTNTSRATIWNSTNTVSPGAIGSTQPVTLTVFGSIPAEQAQTLAAGGFKDTVVVSVTF